MGALPEFCCVNNETSNCTRSRSGITFECKWITIFCKKCLHSLYSQCIPSFQAVILLHSLGCKGSQVAMQLVSFAIISLFNCTNMEEGQSWQKHYKYPDLTFLNHLKPKILYSVSAVIWDVLQS